MEGSDHILLEAQMTQLVTRVEKSIKANLMRALLGGFRGSVDFTLMGHFAFGLRMGVIDDRPSEA